MPLVSNKNDVSTEQCTVNNDVSAEQYCNYSK